MLHLLRFVTAGHLPLFSPFPCRRTPTATGSSPRPGTHTPTFTNTHAQKCTVPQRGRVRGRESLTWQQQQTALSAPVLPGMNSVHKARHFLPNCLLCLSPCPLLPFSPSISPPSYLLPPYLSLSLPLPSPVPFMYFFFVHPTPHSRRCRGLVREFKHFTDRGP